MSHSSCLGIIVWMLALSCSLTVAAQPSGEQQPTAAELQQRIEMLERQLAELRQLVQAQTPAGETTQGDSSSLMHRLDLLETAIAELRQEVQAIGDDAHDTAEAVDDLSESDLQRAHVSVYGSVVALDYEGADSMLDAEAVELVLSGRPHQRLGFFTEVEFERAAEVGGERGGEVVVEQAYATLGLTSWLGFKAGVVLMPFGNHNLDHYAPTREVIARPLVSHVVVPSDWTDNGFGFTGRKSVGAGWVVDLETYLVAGLDENIAALDSRAARQPFGQDNNNNKAAIARLAVDHHGKFEAGVSLYSGKYDDESLLDLTGWASHLSARLGPLHLVGEYNCFAVEQPVLDHATLTGFYLRGVLDLFRPLLRQGRHGELFPQARLSLVAQFGEVEKSLPTLLGESRNIESRWTLGLNYRPSHSWVLKVNREENTRKQGLPILHGDADAWLAAVGFVY